LEELNVSLANLKDDANVQYLMANMIPNIKRLNISGFHKMFGDFGMLLMGGFNDSKLIKLINLIVFCKVKKYWFLSLF